jgi:hypothetical protein
LFPTTVSVSNLCPGLVYKKGKFSAIEEQQLKNAIEAFKAVRGFRALLRTPLICQIQSRGLTDEQILEIIFQKNEKGKENAFWSEISTVVQCPVPFLFHIFRSRRNPATPDNRRLSPCPEGIPPEEAAGKMVARGGQLIAAVRHYPFSTTTPTAHSNPAQQSRH